jgi:hypothetical protein
MPVGENEANEADEAEVLGFGLDFDVDVDFDFPFDVELVLPADPRVELRAMKRFISQRRKVLMSASVAISMGR